MSSDEKERIISWLAQMCEQLDTPQYRRRYSAAEWDFDGHRHGWGG